MINKKKKISILQTLRILTQIVFFILLPGLYINAFSGIKLLYIGILDHNFNFTESFPQLISAISILPITLLLGRFFCGWLCTFGALGDLLYLLSRKVFKISFHVNEKVDRVLKYVKYVLLAFIIIAVWSLSIIDASPLSPWDVFGTLATIHKLPNFSYAITEFTIGFILLLAIMSASLFIERFFCRYLCPLGAVFAIISHLKFIRIKKPSDQCGSCRACTKNCAMGIPLYQKDSVQSGECINCLKCTQKCPRNNIHVNVVNTAVNPALVGALAVTAITGVYCIGTITSDHISTANVNNIIASATTKNTNSIYNDGTYEGSGTGFRGGNTTVSVTIKGGNITDIEAQSYDDDPPYFNSAFDSVISQIIDTQSVDVDTVSGATFSSQGIMEAVSDALSNAQKDSGNSSSEVTPTAKTELADKVSVEKEITTAPTATTTATPTTAPTPTVTLAAKKASTANTSITNTNTSNTNTAKTSTASTANTSTSSTNNSTIAKPKATSSPTPKPTVTKKLTSTPVPKVTKSSKYKDGIYEGSGQGFRRGITTVSVTIKNDVITNVEVVSNGDTPQFFDRASTTVISDILNSQSTNVDVVSGATYSSMGIMNAVEEALNSALN